MAEELDAMLSRIQQKFDLTFQEAESQQGLKQERPLSINPENNSSPIAIRNEQETQSFSAEFVQTPLQTQLEQTHILSKSQNVQEMVKIKQQKEQKLSEENEKRQYIVEAQVVCQKIQGIEGNRELPGGLANIELVPLVQQVNIEVEVQKNLNEDEIRVKHEQQISQGIEFEKKTIQLTPIQMQVLISGDILNNSKVEIVEKQSELTPIGEPQSKQNSFDKEDIKQEGDTGQLSETSELMSYRSLTEKFQVALSRLKHSASSTNYLNDFAARQEHYQRKKVTDLNLLRVEKEKNLTKLCPAKPLINSRSQKLLINHKPIHQRYQAIIKDKQKKIELQQAEKQARIDEEEEMILNEMKDHQEQLRKKLGDQVRTEDEYYESMKHWAEARDKKVQELAQKKKQQGKGSTTFKPHINSKSDLMMKKKPTRVPIYEKAPVVKKIVTDSNCTFKPNLNKTLKK